MGMEWYMIWGSYLGVLTFLWFDHQILSSLGLFGMRFQMVMRFCVELES